MARRVGLPAAGRRGLNNVIDARALPPITDPMHGLQIAAVQLEVGSQVAGDDVVNLGAQRVRGAQCLIEYVAAQAAHIRFPQNPSS